MTTHQLACKWLLMDPNLTSITGTFLNENEIKEAAESGSTFGYEQYGNYVPTVLPRRYDAFLYVDQTTAVRPLFRPTAAELPEEAPETYPTGV